MRRSLDPHASRTCALVFLLGSALVLPNKAFAQSSTLTLWPEIQAEACALPSLRQMNYRLEAPAPSGGWRSPALSLGDINKDGRLDFLVGLQDASARFLNMGGGNFQVLSNLDAAFQDAAVADFNQDGYVDVATVQTDLVSVKLGFNPTWPALPLLTPTRVGRYATSLRAGDFNADGKFDLAVVNTLGNSISVLLGNGNGDFSLPVNFAVQENPHALVVNDFNGDGRLDVVTVNEYSDSLSVLLGNGSGGFSVQHSPANSLPQDVVAWDYNRDGKLDLAVVNRGWSTVSVLRNDGNGAFAVVNRWDLPFVGGAITANDFNRDGHEDIAVAHYEDSTVQVFFTDGQGGVCSVSQLNANFTACCSGTDLTSADLNGDGTPELVLAKGQDVAVWWSNGSTSVNTPPTIAALAPLTIAGGSVNFTAALATVNDAETAAGELTVELGALPPGLTLNNLTNNNGTINASFNLICAPVVGAQTLNVKVSDPQGQSANVNVPLTFVPNTFPVLGAYPDVTLGSGTTRVTPTQRPSDNGTIVSLVATAAGYGGQVSIAADGVVTIANNGVAGRYQVVVGATDNCFNSWAVAFSFTIPSTPSPTCDTLGFNPPIHYETGATPSALAAGDVNADGLPDLVVANRDSNNITILLGTNNGGVRSFRNAASYDVGLSPRAVTINDFNGDGKPDLAVVNHLSDTVTILTNNGAGAFSVRGNYDAGNKPFSITMGDFNSDNKLDLVIVNDGLGSIAILDGQGDGSFGAARHLWPGPSPQAAQVGDFNKDGKADLVVANSTTNEVAVLLGWGDGTFAETRTFNAGAGWNPSPIALGDVNNDGNVDLVVGKTGFRQVVVMYGTGTGAFSVFTAFLAGTEPQSLTLADFNRDGKLDVAVANAQDNSITVFPGDGRGAYDTLQGLPFTVGARPLALLSGDFNGDSKPDLSLVNSGAGTVSVLLNGCSQ
jgi:hypothetical protein